jgi:hypothetical protein
VRRARLNLSRTNVIDSSSCQRCRNHNICTCFSTSPPGFLVVQSSTQSLYSSLLAASFSFSAFSLKYSSLMAYILVVKGPSNIIAKTYMMQTSTERRNPIGFPNQNEVPKNDIAEPTYIGLLRILNGNDVTLSGIKMPK